VPATPTAGRSTCWPPWPASRASSPRRPRSAKRIESRTIQVLDTPPDLPFPHVSQTYLIERHVTALDGTPLSDVAALGVTSLDATRATPEDIASLVRGQWAIESLHWIATPSTAKTTPPSAPARPGPWPPSASNLAVGALHLAGRHDITEATRWASRNMNRPFTILALTS
jgi:hypothetical protein